MRAGGTQGTVDEAWSMACGAQGVIAEAAPRRALDYYPTPPCAVLALRQWWETHGRELYLEADGWLDPAAGPGYLLEVLEDERARRAGIEIDPRHAGQLATVAARHAIGDALDGRNWGFVRPAGVRRMGVVANPPFSQIRAFVDKAIAWAAEQHTVAVVLMRTGWLRAAAQLSLPLPHHQLQLTWRPSFTGSGATDTATYSWGVWRGDGLGGPRRPDQGQLWRLRRPLVSAELVARHRDLAKAVE